ncbi:hypothetical protein AB0F72_10530 [Actinoplanes sp. NPDC023936]|uniref:hypothetical protein n=1 Tax=Actinoplanes sp. NPDC023936 TaxID=3154910 RepID=UPI0033D00F11
MGVTYSESGEPSTFDAAAFEEWRSALYSLTGTKEAARAWRHHRYRFAHRLGTVLSGTSDPRGPVHGPAVYGVWLRGGLLYVGQTLQAQRRLRDLPVGESHHLANTFPPEVWERIVVITWPDLPSAAALLAEVTPRDVGLALEHRLQEWLRPLANSQRRTTTGDWTDVEWSSSRSIGARLGARVGDLFHDLQAVWIQGAEQTSAATPENSACRVVFPDLLR